MKRSNMTLVIEAIADLEKATTHEIIKWIENQGVIATSPRVIGQICSCLPIVKKLGTRESYVVWGKGPNFDKIFKSKQQ